MNGYVDLQVNGYAGVDFNQDELGAAALHTACERLAADGVATVLATVITEDVNVMCKRLARLAELRKADPLANCLIAGFHIEGPFISAEAGYRGAHPVDAIRPADLDVAKRLFDAADGLARLWTLAPEQDAGGGVTRWLVGRGMTVSAGHTNASTDELRRAIDAGLSLFTHLGNGCPMQMHRHDNIIQRVLSIADRLRCCFIADGVHVPPFALRNYLRAAGVERSIVVTDAMAAAALGPGTYTLGRWTVEVDEHLAAWAPGRAHLVGSAGTMQHSRRVLRELVGLTDAECQMVLVDNPARVLSTTT